MAGTGAAVPSDQIADLKANAETLDQFVSSTDVSVVTRTGKNIKTIAGVEQEADKAVKSAGWFVVGNFADGFTFTAYNQVGRDSTGQMWSYNGSLPFTVAAGTVPSEPDYTNRGDAALRSELAGGTALISDMTAQKVRDRVVTTSVYGGSASVGADIGPALQAAYDDGIRDIYVENSGYVWLSSSYTLTGMIIRGRGIYIGGGNVKGAKLIGIDHYYNAYMKPLDQPVPIQSNQTTKIVHRDNDTANGQRFYVLTTESSGKLNVLYTLESGNGPADFDANHGLVRVVNVNKARHAFACLNNWDADSGNVTVFGGGIEGRLFNLAGLTGLDSNGASVTNTIQAHAVPSGGYVEYQVPLDELSSDEFNVLYFTSGGSSTDVSISVDGVVEKNFSAVNANNLIKTEKIEMPKEKSKTATIRVTNNAGGTYYHICANYYLLKDLPQFAKVDTWKVYKTAFSWFDTSGANDYAFYVDNANAFAGSYHGGETGSYLRWRVGGEPLDPSVNFSTGQFFVAGEISLVQRTNIANALDTYSTTLWSLDGQYSFKATIEGDLDVQTAYTCMSPCNSAINTVLHPRDLTLSGSRVAMGNINDIVQYDAGTFDYVRSTFTLFDNSLNKYGGVQIWNNGTTYKKLYYGPVDGTFANIDRLSFESVREFGAGKY